MPDRPRPYAAPGEDGGFFDTLSSIIVTSYEYLDCMVGSDGALASPRAARNMVHRSDEFTEPVQYKMDLLYQMPVVPNCFKFDPWSHALLKRLGLGRGCTNFRTKCRIGKILLTITKTPSFGLSLVCRRLQDINESGGPISVGHRTPTTARESPLEILFPVASAGGRVITVSEQVNSCCATDVAPGGGSGARVLGRVETPPRHTLIVSS